MKHSIILLICCLSFAISNYAQPYTNMNLPLSINNDGTAGNSSAILDLKSTTQGLLVPRMSTTERVAISSPALGLVVYDETTASFWYYNSTKWIDINAVANMISDKDNDTKIFLEQSDDDDHVRLITNDVEQLSIGDNLVQIKATNSLLVGDTTSGLGDRLLWIPSKKALYGGGGNTAGDSIWDMNKMGEYAFSFGINNMAYGQKSASWGENNVANEYVSSAWGSNNIVTKAYATGFGRDNKVTGEGGTVWGLENEVSKDYASAWGFINKATGPRSTSWGQGNTASGTNATASGMDNTATGQHSMAWGESTLAEAKLSTTWGQESSATALRGTAWGYNNEVSGNNGTSWGVDNVTSGINGTSWGEAATASQKNSTAWGEMTIASATNATSSGSQTTASEENATAWGSESKATAQQSTAWGRKSTAAANQATAWGQMNLASGINGTTWGLQDTAAGAQSTAVGMNTKAAGVNSLSMGLKTKALGTQSLATGEGTRAEGKNSASFGLESFALGENAMAWGEQAFAKGDYSTAWGNESQALGDGSTAMGLSRAVAPYSIAIGGSYAGGNLSFASGTSIAQSYGEHVVGIYNTLYSPIDSADIHPTDRVFVVGNGTPTTASNALTILKNGNIGIAVDSPSFKLHLEDEGAVKVNFTSIDDTAEVLISAKDADATLTFAQEEERVAAVGWSESNNALVVSTNADTSVFINNHRIGINGVPSHNLTVVQSGLGPDTTGLAISSGGDKWSFFVSSTGNLELYNGSMPAGTFQAGTGMYMAISDRREKTNVRPLTSIVDKLLALNPVSYNMKGTARQHKESIGVIAQEINELFPELTTYNETQDRLLVNYTGLTVINTKAIQEVLIENQRLKDKISNILSRLEQLESVDR